MESSELIDISSIVNILTLRYDPNFKSNLPIKTWEDFGSAMNQKIDYDVIEKMISDEIYEKISSKEVCLALSGGVDSTLMLGLTRKLFPDLKINTFSIRFADSVDETNNAGITADYFETEHKIIDIENYLKELPKAISIIKKPFWDLHWYYVVKTSSNYGNTLISGDGGDEIFGGYTFRYKKFLNLLKQNYDPINLMKNYLACHERDHVPDQEKIFGEKITFSWDLIFKHLELFFKNKLEPIDKVFLADYNGKLLYNFNPINSKICNYFKINLVAPMLTDKIISYGMQIPIHLKFDEKTNIGKLPLRKILEKNGIQNLVSNEKLGFNVNTVNLWKSHGFEICSQFFDKANVIKEKWISDEWIIKHFKREQNDVRYINKFYGILSFEIWTRIFVTQDLSPDTKLC